jgi:colanic acid biosynthesis glycosyl transferase WcaI
MHLILHTQYYPPEIGAPQTRLHEMAIGLMKNGTQVTVLTAMPNYPSGHIYSGYGGLLKTEFLDGVRVIRTAIYPTQSTGLLPRLLSYFSFVLSSLMAGVWKIRKADYVLTESPPLFLGLSGFLLSRLVGAHWIFNVSDLWPESVFELGIIERDSLSYRLGSALEKFCYRKALLITCQSKTILENIQERFSNVRVYHLSNGVDTDLFKPNGRKSDTQNFHVVYAGLHGLAQGLDQIIMAGHQILSEDHITFTLVGDGPEKRRLIQMSKEMDLKNIHFSKPLPKENIPDLLQSADGILVPLKTQLTGAVPSKLYEAMAMGKPVILIAGSEAAQIVHESNCGIVVSPGDVESLVEAIRYLKNHPEACIQMGKNGRMTAIRKFSRKNIVNQFAQLLMQG